MGQLRLTVNRLSEQIERTDARLDAAASEATRATADQKLVAAQQERSMAEVRLRVDSNSNLVSRLSQDVVALGAGLRLIADRLNQVVTVLPPAVATSAPAASDGVAPVPLPPIVLPVSATVLYDAAQRDLVSGRYDLAIEGFRELLQKFPTAPDAANAQFAIGEAYARSSRCVEAIPEYRKVLSDHRQSDKVPDAYFMLGTCHRTLGQLAEATQILATLIERFPSSTAAARARDNE